MNPTDLTKSHRPSAARVVRIRLHYYLLRQYLHVLQVHKFYRIKCRTGLAVEFPYNIQAKGPQAVGAGRAFSYIWICSAMRNRALRRTHIDTQST
jgi:hypothetical protein